MYNSNSNFGAGCPNWADLRFKFVHFTDIIEQSKSVYLNTHLVDWNQEFFKTSSNTVPITGFDANFLHISGTKHISRYRAVNFQIFYIVNSEK